MNSMLFLFIFIFNLLFISTISSADKDVEMTGPPSNTTSIDKATVDNAGMPASNAMSIDKATVEDNAIAMSIDKATVEDNAIAISIDKATVEDNAGTPVSNAMSVDEAIVDKPSAEAGSDSSEPNKGSDGSQCANQEVEAESFLRGISIEETWQELISKWLAFEKDHPFKGVMFSFLYRSLVWC